MLPSINPSVFENDLISTKRLVLFAFIDRRESSADQFEQLKKLSLMFRSRLQIYLGEERYLKWFKEKFSFRGTPFYLFFSKGEVRHRLYGHTTESDLMKVIDSLLPSDHE